ncbi:uncharacterized protein LOC135543433 [Oncorhynchus masou masou]|uniref:uncharacterized protein LOC135543433 n=1 Tax=Oncorhynchus masou masou TaxID=90313 RepID=UPI003183F68A
MAEFQKEAGLPETIRENGDEEEPANSKAEEMDTSEDLQDDNLIERERFHSSNNELQDGHLAVRRNVILERTKFNQRQQEAGETADDFISALHCLSEHCGYGALLSEKIRNRLVMGLRDKRLSEQLQMDPEITLDEAVTRIRQKQQDLPENTFKATSNAANIEGVLSHSKQQCPANSQCQSEKNKNTERPQQPQTTQENEEDPLDTDDFIEDFRPGGEKPHYCAYCGQNFQKRMHNNQWKTLIRKSARRCTPLKQKKLQPGGSHTSQSRLNHLVFDFIEDVQPFSLEEVPSFRKPVEGISGGERSCVERPLIR